MTTGLLGAAAAAAAVPAPGGLGPTEAAYIAGLALAGLDRGTALATVLLFRLATYWLPLLPGGVSYRVLRRQGPHLNRLTPDGRAHATAAPSNPPVRTSAG